MKVYKVYNSATGSYETKFRYKYDASGNVGLISSVLTLQNPSYPARGKSVVQSLNWINLSKIISTFGLSLTISTYNGRILQTEFILYYKGIPDGRISQGMAEKNRITDVSGRSTDFCCTWS